MTSRACAGVWCLAIALSAGAGLSGCASGAGELPGVDRRVLDELGREGPPSGGGAPATAGAVPPPMQALPADGPITLADLLAVAEAHHPALAAARSEVGITAGQVRQASLYPNPRLELSSEEIPFRSGFEEAITTLGVTQPIVLGGRLRAAVDAAEAEQAASRARVELRAREIFGALAQLHARILAVRRADALYAELAELGGRTLGMARTRFEARAAPETEVIRPQIELYQIDLARARLAREKAAAVEQLSLLLGGIEVDAERLSGEITDEPAALGLDDLCALVRERHPALAVGDRDIEAAAARLDRIRAERMPDLDVRVGAGYKGESDDGIFEIGAGVVLPVWDSRQGDIVSARFDLMRARQERAAAENELLRRLSEAHGEYESARAQLEAVRDRIVPAAARSYEQTQEAYRGGRAAFLELLDAQRTLTEARATLIELSGAAAAARARIMQIVGPLEALPPGGPGGLPEEAEPSTSTTQTQKEVNS